MVKNSGKCEEISHRGSIRLTAAYTASDEHADHRPGDQDGHGDGAEGRVVVEDVVDAGLVALVGAGVDDGVHGNDGADDGPTVPPTRTSIIQDRRFDVIG